LKIDRRPLLKEALEADQLDIGRAMALVAAPEPALRELLDLAGSLPQADLKERVAQMNQGMRYAYPRRSVDSRRLLEALRLLTLVEHVEGDDRKILERIQQRADQILGVSFVEGPRVRARLSRSARDGRAAKAG
jgi:hypothetical protein